MKVALIQMQVASSPAENLQTARTHLKDAAAGGADIAVLPEMFCCPYETPQFPTLCPEGRRRNLAGIIRYGKGKRSVSGSWLCARGRWRQNLQHIICI
ncbi:nitrilase-related carbon-nitrogen hydrolase [Anaerotignum sp.]|uniref:nitrilase-related carbon-nitrogen hydrolase n=1 Tax=Anaerotignum sp. TaxID=2039241 RepID=UPI00399F6B96